MASNVFTRGPTMFMVTGPVTSSASASRGEATKRAPNRSASYTGPNVEVISSSQPLHEPRMVIALGDCARDCGVFRGGYGVEGPVGDVLPVDLQVPGCPPNPEAIVRALRGLTGR